MQDKKREYLIDESIKQDDSHILLRWNVFKDF